MGYVIQGGNGIYYRYEVETRAEALRIHGRTQPDAGVLGIMSAVEFDAQQSM